MAFSKLADIKKKAAEKASFSGDGESSFLSLKDGDKVSIRFLQEFDDDSPLYDERRGAMKVIMEHVSPADYKKSAVCTAESEGRCWACEQTSLPDIGKNWKPRMRLYANVLLRSESGDKVKVIKGGFSDKGIGEKLINIAEEFEQLGGQDISYSRRGSGKNDTSYDVLPKAPKKMTKEEEGVELIDLSRFAKEISYDNQAAFYTGSGDESTTDDWTS
jgi:hypothetical protein